MSLFYIVYRFNSVLTATYIKAHDEEDAKCKFKVRVGSPDRIQSIEVVRHG